MLGVTIIITVNACLQGLCVYQLCPGPSAVNPEQHCAQRSDSGGLSAVPGQTLGLFIDTWSHSLTNCSFPSRKSNSLGLVFCAYTALCHQLQVLHLPTLWLCGEDSKEGVRQPWSGSVPTVELPAGGDAVSLPGIPRQAPVSVLPRSWLLSPLFLSHPFFHTTEGVGRGCGSAGIATA